MKRLDAAQRIIGLRRRLADDLQLPPVQGHNALANGDAGIGAARQRALVQGPGWRPGRAGKRLAEMACEHHKTATLAHPDFNLAKRGRSVGNALEQALEGDFQPGRIAKQHALLVCGITLGQVDAEVAAPSRQLGNHRLAEGLQVDPLALKKRVFFV